MKGAGWGCASLGYALLSERDVANGKGGYQNAEKGVGGRDGGWGY